MADLEEDMHKPSPPTVVAADESGPAQAWQWIDEAAQWPALAAAARGAGQLAIDTEFVRRRTYHAQLGLLQLAVGNQVWLLDPLQWDAAREVGELLADEGLTKLIHAGGEDIEVLTRWTGQRPRRLIDTQIAAQMIGAGGQIGYQKLVAERLGVALSKGEQQSDWLRRPLTAQQCRYAADDVRYLQPLAAAVLGDVEQMGRRSWLEEECERQVERVLAPPPAWPHLAERHAGQYPVAVQYRLGELLRWRNEEAERRDKPRSWILPNATVVALAFAGPSARPAIIKALREAGRREPEQDAERFARMLAEFGDAPDDFPPAAAPLEGEQKGALTRLRAELEQLAAQHGLAPEFLATRISLEARVRDGSWPDGLGQWRLQLLEGLKA